MQVFFVMLFFPVIMNALQYYIIDGFIKDQKLGDHEPIPSDDEEEENNDEDRRTRRRRSGGVDGQYHSDEDDQSKNDGVKTAEVSDKEIAPEGTAKSRSDPKKLDEYDPATDGERGSTSGSSARSRDELASPSKDTAKEAKST